MKRSYLTIFCVAACACAGISSFAQSPAKLAAINKKVVGKWVSANGKDYIVFYPDQSCEVGALWPDGKWHIDKLTLGAWQVGNDFSCGGGALDLTGPNTLTRDSGEGGTPEIFHRKPSANASH